MKGGKIHYLNLQNKNKESIIKDNSNDNSNDKMFDQHVEIDYEIERKMLA